MYHELRKVGTRQSPFRLTAASHPPRKRRRLSQPAEPQPMSLCVTSCLIGKTTWTHP
jgi:hypothetical protein